MNDKEKEEFQKRIGRIANNVIRISKEESKKNKPKKEDEKGDMDR
jgi:hypothetical protein